MDSSVSAKEEIWFLLMCHYISNALCYCLEFYSIPTISDTHHFNFCNVRYWLKYELLTYVSTCFEPSYGHLQRILWNEKTAWITGTVHRFVSKAHVLICSLNIVRCNFRYSKNKMIIKNVHMALKVTQTEYKIVVPCVSNMYVTKWHFILLCNHTGLYYVW